MVAEAALATWKMHWISYSRNIASLVTWLFLFRVVTDIAALKFKESFAEYYRGEACVLSDVSQPQVVT